MDNVLWSGRVLESGEYDPDTSAIKAFNARLLTDDRIFLSMVPIADGLTLAFKRSIDRSFNHYPKVIFGKRSRRAKQRGKGVGAHGVTARCRMFQTSVGAFQP